MNFLYPRLPRPVGEGLAMEHIGRRLGELSAQASSTCDTALYGATGGTQAPVAHINNVRAKVVETATGFGFPEPGHGRELVAFDRAAARLLLADLQIVPVEAAVPGVWDFFALMLMPDVVAWRFPGTNVERWLYHDRTRHCFARLWWQAYLLVDSDGSGEPDLSLLDQLHENELNQIFERTQLSQNRRITRAVAAAFLEASARRPKVSRRELIRGVLPHLLRMRWFTSLDSLDDTELARLFHQLFDESARMLARQGADEATAHGEDEKPGAASRVEAPEQDGLKPYRAYDRSDLSDPRTADWADLVRSIVRVVDVEEPVQASRVFRVMASSAGARLTENLLADLVKATKRARRQGHIHVKGQRGPDGIRDATLTLRDHPVIFARELGPRRVDEVPPQEVAATLELVRAPNPLMTDDDAVRSIAALWGLGRVTDKLRESIAYAIHRSNHIDATRPPQLDRSGVPQPVAHQPDSSTAAHFVP